MLCCPMQCCIALLSFIYTLLTSSSNIAAVETIPYVHDDVSPPGEIEASLEGINITRIISDKHRRPRR
uniref:Putative secreted protein n=1 Tax=Anopheles triannulatus TaxID=58253 RepID=A0A2M4B7M4_9DIPT